MAEDTHRPTLPVTGGSGSIISPLVMPQRPRAESSVRLAQLRILWEMDVSEMRPPAHERTFH